jgi:rod shape-determining protein MreD
MTLWLLIPLLFFVAVVQATLVPLVTVAGFKIDLALILVVVQALVGAPGTAVRWGFVVGLFLDLTSGLPFGIHTFVLTVVGLLMDLGQDVFFRGNVVAPPLAMIAATVIENVMILGLLSFSNSSIDWGRYLFGIILPTAVLNTVAMPLVYFPLRWLGRRWRPQMQV